MFKKDFSGCEESFVQKNINFFEELEDVKILEYFVRSFRNEGVNFDLLGTPSGNAMPVPIFFQIIGQACPDDYQGVLDFLKKMGIEKSVSYKSFRTRSWQEEIWIYGDGFTIGHIKNNGRIGSIKTGGRLADEAGEVDYHSDPDFRDGVDILLFITEKISPEAGLELLEDSSAGGLISADVERHLYTLAVVGLQFSEQEKVWAEKIQFQPRENWGFNWYPDYHNVIAGRYLGDPAFMEALNKNYFPRMLARTEVLYKFDDGAVLENTLPAALLRGIHDASHDETLIQKGFVKGIEVIPVGKRPFSGENSEKEVEENKNPQPFFQDPEGNNYFLVEIPNSLKNDYRGTRFCKGEDLVGYISQLTEGFPVYGAILVIGKSLGKFQETDITNFPPEVKEEFSSFKKEHFFQGCLVRKEREEFVEKTWKTKFGTITLLKEGWIYRSYFSGALAADDESAVKKINAFFAYKKRKNSR